MAVHGGLVGRIGSAFLRSSDHSPWVTRWAVMIAGK